MRDLNESDVYDFAECISTVGNISFEYKGTAFEFVKGTVYSINNQGQYLRDENYLGRNLEYTVKYAGKSYPVALQLYMNNRDLFRLYVYGKGSKMLTSVNLSNCLDDEIINFRIQIKVSSPQSLSTEERTIIRDDILRGLRDEGIMADKRNWIDLGAYDLRTKKFLNVTPEDFIAKLVLIGIAKNQELLNY